MEQWSYPQARLLMLQSQSLDTATIEDISNNTVQGRSNSK